MRTIVKFLLIVLGIILFIPFVIVLGFVFAFSFGAMIIGEGFQEIFNWVDEWIGGED